MRPEPVSDLAVAQEDGAEQSRIDPRVTQIPDQEVSEQHRDRRSGVGGIRLLAGLGHAWRRRRRWRPSRGLAGLGLWLSHGVTIRRYRRTHHAPAADCRFGQRLLHKPGVSGGPGTIL